MNSSAMSGTYNTKIDSNYLRRMYATPKKPIPTHRTRDDANSIFATKPIKSSSIRGREHLTQQPKNASRVEEPPPVSVSGGFNDKPNRIDLLTSFD